LAEMGPCNSERLYIISRPFFLHGDVAYGLLTHTGSIARTTWKSKLDLAN